MFLSELGGSYLFVENYTDQDQYLYADYQHTHQVQRLLNQEKICVQG